MRALAKLMPWMVALGLPVVGAHEAAARPPFVDVVSTHLALPYEPPCRLCHIQGTTGAGTIVTPFGMSMLARGLTEDESSVTKALDALAADGTDSDGDHVPDIEELRGDRDPNTPADVPLGPGGPTYGCAVSALASPARGDVVAAHLPAATVALLLLLRRRARRTTPARAQCPAPASSSSERGPSPLGQTPPPSSPVFALHASRD